jgi:hypothetical protein
VGSLAFCVACAGVTALLVPGPGKLAAVGLGLLGAVAGLLAYRRQGGARGRLLGAAAVAIGLGALALALAKVGLTLVAIDRLAGLAG